MAISGCGLMLALITKGPVVIGAQVLLIGLPATLSIHLSRLLHDLVPSQQAFGSVVRHRHHVVADVLAVLAACSAR
jgi:hypothetical protein